MVQYYAERLKLEAQARNAANWFFYIAFVSLFNTALILAGRDQFVVIGLGVTLFVAFLAHSVASVTLTDVALTSSVLAICVSIAASGVFILLGIVARRKSYLAYVLGIGLYGLDAILMLLYHEYLAVVWHVVASIFLCRGIVAISKLDENEMPPPRVS